MFIATSYWFEILGFYDIINMGSSQGLLLVILLLPRVTEILQLLDSRTGPFMMIQILGWVNSEPWIWAWVVAELARLLAVPSLHHQGKFFSTALARPPNAATQEAG